MTASTTPRIRPAAPADGPAIRRLAAESNALDMNSQYFYVLWCRDFARTSVVAEHDGQICAFLIAYDRPAEPGVLFVWQVCVRPEHRGKSLAGRMLDSVVGEQFTFVECTVTPSNRASAAFFSAFAERHGTSVERWELFSSDVLGPDHEPEILFRIGPLQGRNETTSTMKGGK